MPKRIKYSNEDLLRGVKLVGEDLGRIPTKNEYKKHPKHIADPCVITRRLGPWIRVFENAGFKASRQQLGYNKKYVNDYERRIKAANLEELYKNIINHPGYSFAQISKHNRAIEKIIQKLGGCDEAAKALYQKFGIIVSVNRITKIKWETKTIKQEFIRIRDMLGKKPTLADLRTHSQYKGIAYGIRKLYGSYNAFCAEIGDDFTAYKKMPQAVEQKRKAYARKLRCAIQKAKGNNVTVRTLLHMCGISEYGIRSLFGSVRNWIFGSRLRKPDLAKIRGYKTNEAILSSIRELANTLGRCPTTGEYDKLLNKKVCATTVIIRFGSWDNALIAARLK